MATFKILVEIYDRLLSLAEREAPLEACGLLAGKEGVVYNFYPLTNMDKSPEHFSMDLAEQFQAVREMRRHGWEILAVWHSHPETPPRLSEEDQRLAFMPGVNYAILSLAIEHRGEMKAYKKEDKRFIEQQIEICLTGEKEL